MVSMQRYIELERAKAITDTEIKQLVVQKDKLRVRDYASLSSSDSLASLCPGVGHGCVLFWVNKHHQEIGHFNLLLRHPGDQYEFFDSYGKTIHEIAAGTSHDGGKKLLRLFAGHKVLQGRHKFQTETKSVNTCGRYAAFRFNCASFSYRGFIELLSYRGIHPDDLVTLLTINVDFGRLNSMKKKR